MRFTFILKKSLSVLGVVMCACALIFALPASIYAQIPFGGTIVSTFYCLNGIWIITGGTGIPGSYMYVYGASVSPFLSGPPTHIGQNMLGWASSPTPCMYYCGVTVCPIGFGLLILPTHGTSL